MYATKYVYTVDKWLPSRTVNTRGDDKDPKWGDTELDDNEREVKRKSAYYVTVERDGEEYEIELQYDVWQTYNVGDTIEYQSERLTDDPVGAIGKKPEADPEETTAVTSVPEEDPEDNAA